MAEIRPFRAVHYDVEKVDIKKVIMPPYDIIRDVEKYYEMDPYNIIRVDKCRDESGDSPVSKYVRAAQTLNSWIDKGILVRDEKPCIYVYSQEYFTPDGKKHEMKGIFGVCRLEPFEKKVVLPHEKTHSGPKADRLMLMRETKANTSPILSLYFDPEAEVEKIIVLCMRKKPYFDFTDDDGIKYRMWKIDDSEIIGQITGFFSGKNLFIADGHHRYETGLNFSREMKEKKGIKGESEYDFILMCLISMEHSGISILPTHRLKKHFGYDLLKAPELERFFKVEKIKTIDELRNIMAVQDGSVKTIGCHIKGENFTLTLKKEEYAKVVDTKKHIMDYWLLYPSILHRLIFERILGMEESLINEGIDYTPDIDEAVRFVKDKGFEAAFFLGPATVNEVKVISENGEVMPQKSTYFLPKLATGLLLNKMEG